MILLEKRRRFSNKDMYIITDNIYNLYNSGLPILSIIELLCELPISKVYKFSLTGISKKLKNGSSLCESFKCYDGLYPEFFTFMLSVGEETGRLSDVLFGLKTYYGRMYKLKNNLIQTLIYPIIVLMAVVILAIFLFVFIIPTFAEIYETLDKSMPTAMKIIIALNNYVSNNYVGTFFFVLCWIIIIPYVFITKIARSYFMKIFSKIKIVKQLNEYFIIILLSIIIKSGINLNRGLEHCSSINNFRVVKSNFKIIKESILMGNTLYEAMECCNNISKYTLIHIKLAEDSGTLEERLIKLEGELADKINSKMKRLMDMVGPILIMLIGVGVLSFILTFILPLFNVMSM